MIDWSLAVEAIVKPVGASKERPNIYVIPRLHSELIDDSRYRYVVIKGGRGGFKTTSFLARMIEESYVYKDCAFLCTREVARSISDSVYAVLKDLIVQAGREADFDIQKTTIINRLTGVRFIFMGLRATGGSTAMSQINKVKGLHKVRIIFIEEGQDVSEESLNVLLPTVSRKGTVKLVEPLSEVEELTDARFFVAMNPNKPVDPILSKLQPYVEAGQATVAHLNMMDIADDQPEFRDEQLINQMELEKGEYYFDHVWNGAPFSLFSGMPFSEHQVLENVPDDDIMCLAVAIDPSFKGGDYTSIAAIGRLHSTGEVVVWGDAWKSAWNMMPAWDGILNFIHKWAPEKVFYEDNALGMVPRQYLAREGINGIPFTSVLNKEERIYKVAAFTKNLISITKNQSNRVWLNNVLDYNDEAEYDDAPDSLAHVVLQTGLIKEKIKW